MAEDPQSTAWQSMFLVRGRKYDNENSSEILESRSSTPCTGQYTVKCMLEKYALR